VLKHGDLAGHHVALRQLPVTQHAVHAFADNVDPALAFADAELDLGIVGEEARQAGQQEMPGERALHLDPEQAARALAAERAFRILNVGDDGEAAAIISLTV
jgi:hypothetical protein